MTVSRSIIARSALPASLIAVIAVVTAVVSAQAQGRGGRAASRPDSNRFADMAVVIQVPTLHSAGARATIVRRQRNGRNEEVILVTRSTTPADLAKAVAALAQARRSSAGARSSEVRAHITAAQARSAAHPDVQRATRDLARLRRAPSRRLQGVATGPAITLALPRTRNTPAAAPAGNPGRFGGVKD